MKATSQSPRAGCQQWRSAGGGGHFLEVQRMNGPGYVAEWIGQAIAVVLGGALIGILLGSAALALLSMLRAVV